MIFKLFEDAIIRELEENEDVQIPGIIYMEPDLFEALRKELISPVTKKPLDPKLGIFVVDLVGLRIEFRPEDYVYDTVH